MSKYPCVEATIEFIYNGSKIRLWIDITNSNRIDMDIDMDGVVRTVREYLGGEPQVNIDDLVPLIPHLNAIQIIQPENELGVNYGTVAYTTSFNDDCHG